MEIKYWAGTDVGRKRSDNEDNFLIDKRLRLFVVADGMGGHASGEIASAMAVHGIREVLHAERDILDVYDDDDPKSHVEVCTLLEYAVHHTCAQIFQKARLEPEKRGMGTTLVVLLVIGARGFIAYVGDSRIYLLRGGVVYQLTEDHSLRNELIRMGKITADEFESSPYANLKNAMTRAVGVYESVEVDTLDFDIIPGDSFLMCSDGLYEYLTDDDIAHAIALPEIREVPGMLIDAANSRGGKDNITAVVVQVAGGADGEDRAAELNFTLDTLKTVPLFRELSYQQLVRVINLARQSALAPGEVLCREGEPGHELMVVLRGRVELTQGGVRVAELGAGSHLGEMSLIDEGLRSVTVTALETGKVLAIGRDDFYEVLRREPALAVKLLWSFVRVLAGRLRATTADLAVARTSFARTMATHAVPDLTELAEETTRPRMPEPVAELEANDDDDDDDELERRPTMISGMLGVPGDTVVAPAPAAPRPHPGSELVATGDTVAAAVRPAGPASTPAAPRPRPGSGPTATGETVVSPPAPPRPRTHSNPNITGDAVVAPPPVPPRPRTSSNPNITGATIVPPSATARPRPSSGPASAGDPAATPRPASPGSSGEPETRTRATQPTNPMLSGELALPVASSELASPRPASSNPAVTGNTVVPPSGAPRPRRGAPQVTKPIESSWSPAPPRAMGAPVVPSPQAPTAPLDAPHLVPPAETDAPKTRRTSRRSTLPQMPGTPFTPAPPAAPPPIHGAPTAPLAAPIIPPIAAPTAPIAAPIIPPIAAPTAPLAAPIIPPIAVPTAPLTAPVGPDVPSPREDAITAPALPVVSPPPPPPPPRGGTMPPPSRASTTQPPPPPPPPRAEVDSDAPRVPAPRHAVATPQAGGTKPPPSSDDESDTRRTQRGMPVPPPPPTRKGDPDDPATPAAEP